MLQVPNIEDVFRAYFEKAVVPDRIIELGTYDGIFSNIVYRLRAAINDKFDFLTFDRLNLIQDIPEKIKFHQMEIFENIDFIGSLIIDNTLILCDNGDKIKEVNILATYLKNNCVIMAHDYFHSRDDFKDNKIWSTCEIIFDDVRDLNLEPYLQEIMINGAWLSLIKRLI